jgi:hypothetical protein
VRDVFRPTPSSFAFVSRLLSSLSLSFRPLLSFLVAGVLIDVLLLTQPHVGDFWTNKALYIHLVVLSVHICRNSSL